MDTFIKYNMTVCLLDLVYNLTNVVPGGQFCYGHSMDTNEAIVLACDTCLRGHCVQVTEIINILENNKNLCLNCSSLLKLLKTCCPPGQIYTQDINWEPPRCGSDHEVDNVSSGKS